jgi:hypothetical protein
MIRRFKNLPVACLALAAFFTAGLVLPCQLASAGTPAAGLGSLPAGPSLLTEVKDKGKNWNKNVYVKKNVYVVKPGKWYVRGWKAKPYYGNILAGVALGTLIGVTAAGIAPVAPAPNLCWYWTSPAMVQGYWDYCY